MNKTLLGLTLAVAAAVSAFAAYPEKTVTMVVPFPPGGSTDAIARVLSQKLQEKLGGTFIIDNKPGATGTIGAAFVKRAAPDGYTLFVSSLGPFVIAPHLIKGVQYDALKDFDPITIAVQAPNVLVVPVNSPDKSVADLLAHLKKTPGKVSFASSGNGSSDHLSAELFWQQTGTEGLHVPYKGGGPAINDLLGGQVDAAFVNINSIIQHIKAGKVRALAISSEKRSPLLADVPTLQEQGVKGAEVQSWQAVAAPKGLPADVKSKLHAAIVASLNDPAVKEKLLAQGFEIVADTPEHFAKYQAMEYARWKSLIEARNIKAD
jgi:tripartite-type tricarboxylate transporter receptor subunit TctC